MLIAKAKNMTEIDVTKIVEGEHSQEDIEKMNNELSDEQKAEVVRAAAEKFKETLGSLSAIRKEKNRVETKTNELAAQAKTSEDKMAQFRSEQVLKAKDRFKKEINLSDEDFKKVEDTFARIDSGHVDADLIYKDIAGAYAFVNSEALLAGKKEEGNFERNAAAVVAAEAGSISSSPTVGEPPRTFSKEAEALAKQAGIPVEAAERQIKGGNVRMLM